MLNSKIVGMLVAAFVAGSFIASPELRVFAANTVFSADIVDGEVKTADLGANAVTAAKIKDNEVKAAEIATNVVGAELNRPVSCIRVASVLPSANVVGVALTNVCSAPQEIGAATMAVIVYDM